MVLHCGERKSQNWNYPGAVASFAAELEEDEEDYEDERKGAAYTPPTKPKTGKAALPLKRDRVCGLLAIVAVFSSFVLILETFW